MAQRYASYAIRLLFSSLFCLLLTGPEVKAGDPMANGDIVGRDLDYGGSVGPIGHVGMWYDNTVLEALRESPVIQRNTLANFKSRSPYWGARYDDIDRDYDAGLAWGWDQRNFSPSYTLAVSACREGFKYIDRRGKLRTVTAVYRSDCFAYSVYKRAKPSKNVSLGGMLTPQIVFKSFPNERE